MKCTLALGGDKAYFVNDQCNHLGGVGQGNEIYYSWNELEEFINSRPILEVIQISKMALDPAYKNEVSKKNDRNLAFVDDFLDLNEFKNIEQNSGDSKERHKKIAYCTFQFEAKTMIDKIAREYDKIHKGKVPIFTLHDCLITTVSHVEELKDFMEKKFIDLFEVAPNLTIEKSNFAIDYRQVI